MEPTKKLYELLKCVYNGFGGPKTVYELLKCVYTVFGVSSSAVPITYNPLDWKRFGVDNLSCLIAADHLLLFIAVACP